MKNKLKFDDVVGKEFGFYGVDNTSFKLGRNVWCAVEDEDDGYRSYLGSVVVDVGDHIFFDRPLGTVRIEVDSVGDFDGFRLVDISDGHVWLQFGTDNSDDYYPMFRFHYEPKKRKEG